MFIEKVSQMNRDKSNQRRMSYDTLRENEKLYDKQIANVCFLWGICELVC